MLRRLESFTGSLGWLAGLAAATAVACGNAHDTADPSASSHKPSGHTAKDASAEHADAGAAQTGAAADGGHTLERFSFFLTSYAGLIDLANAAGPRERLWRRPSLRRER